MPLLSTLGRRWTPLRRAAAALTPPILWRWMNQTLVVGAIADRECYDPVFKPWLRRDFADLYHTIAGHTEVSVERCWTLARLLSQSLNLPGDVMEAGVYRGGTARLLKGLMGKGRRLWLFDSFAGMRAVSPELDRVKAGSFADTSLDSVRDFVGATADIEYRPGWIPASFAGLEATRYCFAHIDLDLHDSIRDALAYLYPRMTAGGAIVFDDYGFAACPGARRAVDAFFADKPEQPLALTTGQAVVMRLPEVARLS